MQEEAEGSSSGNFPHPFCSVEFIQRHGCTVDMKGICKRKGICPDYALHVCNVAQRLNCSKKTVYRMISAGQILFVKLSPRKTLISRSSVEAAMVGQIK
jgi:excisionase family DNA binding protein